MTALGHFLKSTLAALRSALPVADEERRMISQRTKAALATARKRGVKLGGDRGVRLSRAARKAGRDAQAARADERAADLAHVICDLRRVGITSLSGIAKALTERRIPTPRGGGRVDSYAGCSHGGAKSGSRSYTGYSQAERDGSLGHN